MKANIFNRVRRTAVVLVSVGLLAGACSDSDDAATTTGAGPGSQATTSAVVVDELEVPWGLAFLPNGDAVVTEREGRLNVISAGDLDQRRTFDVPGVVSQGEGGLLGVAVSPAYESDRWIYVYMTTASDNRVVRFRIGPDNRSLAETEVVVDGIDRARFHNGGRIAFGPDGMLYVATGDAGDRQSAQDPSDLNGKILRMTPDGDPAPGNSTPGSLVHSYGHRNVQGLAWDAGGRLYATEFGQNTFDEVNHIEAGGNYGWPVVEGQAGTQGGRFTNPIVTWTTDEASPSGIAFVQESRGSALYVAALRGQRLWRIPLDGDGNTGEPEPMLRGEYGRLRTAAVAPDRTLWIMTSNSDGRGDGTPDRIIRLAGGSPPQ